MFKRWVKKALLELGYDVRRAPAPFSVPQIPDREFYDPLFSPWLGYGEFGRLYGTVRPYAWAGPQSCYVLYALASQALPLGGEFWECGVYRGGTALLLSRVIETNGSGRNPTELRLFDTFEGMPETDPRHDLHQQGDFGDTNLEEVRKRVSAPNVFFHKGRMPETFRGLEESKIAFAHIDVDIYQSVADCCDFIYPRLLDGGFMVFDDYGFADCPGARKAVDEFFESKPERPLVLPTSQAIVFASPRGNRAASPPVGS